MNIDRRLNEIRKHIDEIDALMDQAESDYLEKTDPLIREKSKLLDERAKLNNLIVKGM